MSLVRLEIENVRIIRNTTVDLDPILNLFGGSNGSGKTSLLEAVYFLGSGRSFRSSQLEPFISKGQDSCTVFGLLDTKGRSVRLGVHRGLNGKRELKINSEVQSRSSDLARELPILVLGPDTVELLLGNPGDRRRFLNWGLFHVERGFSEVWADANRCLKQRNRLLRNPGLDRKELSIWTDRLVECAVKIDQQRKDYCDRFSAIFMELGKTLTAFQDVECQYSRGWDQDKPLSTVCLDQVESDIKRGYTQSGFHRADIRVTVGGRSAASTCSRGELKLLAWAMVLSQGRMMAEESDQPLTYLVDDFVSELDECHRNRICQLLLESANQILVTGVEEKMLNTGWGDVPRKVFHVEQGVFRAQEQQNE